MTTIDTAATNGTAIASPDTTTPKTTAATPAMLSSPFALTETATPTTAAGPGGSAGSGTAHVGMASPFLDGLLSEAGINAEDEAVDLLLAELEDEEFAEALEALANEAAARSLRSPSLWNEQGGAPVLDTTEAEQWMEAVAARAIDAIDELERHFGDRSVESVGEDEIDQLLAQALPGYTPMSGIDPLAAQELFFKKLGKKLKKVAKGAANIVKKGVKLASKILPIGQILKRLKGIIRPLLKRVLAKAIGKLPKKLQEPAKRLARKFGLQKENEFETEYEFLAAEFDTEITQALFASDAEFAAFEAELQYESNADAVEPNLTADLDQARLRLGQELEAATPGEPPIEAMEQFIPMALLPIAKMGIKIAGRKRVISFVAGLLAKLIAPVVGRQLARPLSAQIADKGLGLLGLEAEAGNGRLGSEAVVAATEEALHEVFTLPEAWLENELLLEMAVGEAFRAAAMRHVPDAALRSEIATKQGGKDRGVWLMMPRATGPAYRYKQYSKRIPVRVTPAVARSVVFSGGETLDDRLHDEGLDTYPVDVELEFFELLPGGELGHITAGTAGTTGTVGTTGTAGATGPGTGGSGTGSPADDAVAATLEFDTLEDPGQLPLPEASAADDARARRPSRGPGEPEREPAADRPAAGTKRPERPKAPMSE